MQFIKFLWLGCALGSATAFQWQNMSDRLKVYDTSSVYTGIIKPVTLFYHPELIWLIGKKVDSTREAWDQKKQKQPWLILLRQDDILSSTDSTVEFSRTIMGVVTWYLIWDGSKEAYHYLTQQQREHEKLRFTSFQALHLLAKTYVVGQDDWLAMVSALIYSDLGKSHQLKQQIRKRSPQHLVDHDDIAKTLFGLSRSVLQSNLPSFHKLSLEVQQSLQLLLTSIPLHWGHLTHLEGGAGMLEPLADALTHQKIEQRLLYQDFLLQICDVAAALAHTDSRGSLTLTETTYQSYRHWLELLATFWQDPKPMSAIKSYLEYRCQQLGLHCTTPREFVVARIACLIRLFEPKLANRLRESFEQLSDAQWTDLIDQFSLEQGFNSWKRNPTYIPALLINIMRHQGIEAIPASTVCLARILKAAELDHQHDSQPLSFNLLAGDAATRALPWPKTCALKQITWSEYQVKFRVKN